MHTQHGCRGFYDLLQERQSESPIVPPLKNKLPNPPPPRHSLADSRRSFDTQTVCASQVFNKAFGNMNDNQHPTYHHSGKFGAHGPLLAILAAIVIGYPLGFVYAYLIKWIPFIYLNFFITVGYGLAFGFIAAIFMKIGQVRNNTVAFLTGIVVGIAGWYLNWNAYLHTLTSHAPLLVMPSQLLKVMKVLYENGAWGVGQLFGAHSTISGIPLAIVWAVEALMIILLAGALGWGSIAQTPYCETHGCWLDQEKKMDKLDAFTNPDHIAALKAGNLAPLDQAQPRVPASGHFARMTLRHSPKCDDYCTLSIANITVTLDKNGKPQEKSDLIVTNLQVPKTMFDYLAQFDHPTAKTLTTA